MSGERLQTALGTTRVFTVPEAKGLEFDVAILWGVVAADPRPGAGSSIRGRACARTRPRGARSIISTWR